MKPTERRRGFFDFLFGLNLERYSPEAERLFQVLAKRSGEADLIDCVRSSRAFTYYGLAWGYTYRSKEDGRIGMGLNRLLLFCPKWSFTIFCAGHELGHVRQLLQGQTEQPIGSQALYKQELEASEFGVQFIRNSKCCGLPALCRFKFVHCLLARQAAFPVQTVLWWIVLWAVIAGVLSYFVGKFLDLFMTKADGRMRNA